MFEAFGLSDVGCLRQSNEDFFITDGDAGVFILADGMGGANAGELAARLSAERLYSYLTQANGSPGQRSLEQGFSDANVAVREHAAHDPALEGMGTTLIAARACDEARLEICSVGDSRAYLCSAGTLTLLTQDQTWVAEVGPRLGLSDDALRQHPMRHILTMAVGISEGLEVRRRYVSLAPHDQLLLCSDGLHGVVDEKIVADTLKSEKSLPDKCHYLVEAAKQQGGPDNITVVLIQRV